jgi:hypothetical protein
MAAAKGKAATKVKAKGKEVVPAETDEFKVAKQQSSTTSQQALSLNVTNDDEFDVASRYLISIKEAKDEVDKQWKSITDPLKLAVRNTDKVFKPLADALDTARNHVRAIMGAHADRKETERRRLQAESDERARKERERLEKQAIKADASGNVEKAELLQQRAATVAAPVVQYAAPKAAGVAMVEHWKFEVVNPAKINTDYLCPDEKKIGDQVRAVKSVEEAVRIIGAGVRVWCERLPKTTGR